MRASVSRDGGPPAEPELDAEGVEVVGSVVVDAVDVPLAGQELLGERRAVVGGVGLVPDDDDRAGVALVADLLGGPQPGQRGTDHDHGRVGLEGVAHERAMVGGRPRRGPSQRPNMAIQSSGVRNRKT